MLTLTYPHTHTHIYTVIYMQLGDRLHSQITNLVSRLHETELQTHSLHSQLIQSNSHREDLTRKVHDAKKMKESVQSLQTELAMMVPHGQFEGVCKDFEASLKREKELKVYLSKHVAAVEQLQTRLQLASQDVNSKELSLSQSRKVGNCWHECCDTVHTYAKNVHTHTLTHIHTHTHTYITHHITSHHITSHTHTHLLIVGST